MVKCPWCGKEMDAEEYLRHSPTCKYTGAWKGEDTSKWKVREVVRQEKVTPKEFGKVMQESMLQATALRTALRRVDEALDDEKKAGSFYRELARTFREAGPYAIHALAVEAIAKEEDHHLRVLTRIKDILTRSR